MGRIIRMFNRDDEVFEETGPASRPASFVRVESEAALDAVFDQPAAGRAALLFLHDPYCPISSHAFEEVEQVDAAVYLVDVSQHSGLGKRVQLRTGIRHESPQAIVLRDGAPSWHASHGRIRAAALREALA